MSIGVKTIAQGDELAHVRKVVSWITLTLLIVLTLASIVNLYDMALMTHAANELTGFGAALGLGATLATLSYVASITDGRVRLTVTCFALVAAAVSATLQVSLYLMRGADWGVALAFGAGLPFFEIALALTDSMLRRYGVEAAQPSASAQADDALRASVQRLQTALEALTGRVDTIVATKPAKRPAPAQGGKASQPAAPVELAVVPEVMDNTNDNEYAEAAQYSQIAEILRLDNQAIADMFGLTRQAVSKWRLSGTAERQIAKRLPQPVNALTVSVNGNGVHHV